MSDKDNKLIGNPVISDYLEPKRFGARFWHGLLLIVVAAIFILFFKSNVIDNKLSEQEIKSTFEFYNISSHWIVKENVSEPGFKGIILVPQITFNIKNVGQKDLKYVFLLGVFRFTDSGKSIGEGYETVFKDPLIPGSGSSPITLTSGFGYRASSKKVFAKNYRNWRTALVEVYAKSPNSKLIFIKSFYISRKIADMNIDVRIQNTNDKKQ